MVFFSWAYAEPMGLLWALLGAGMLLSAGLSLYFWQPIQLPYRESGQYLFLNFLVALFWATLLIF
ncbi:MAG: hypothetical protein OHK0053_29230 [Microscillaceae bacterium]